MVLLSRMPELSDGQRIQFPQVSEDEEIAAVGGNLSVGVLLSAYEQGLFPWYNPGEPIIWWNPSQRMVLPVGALHLGSRTERTIRKAPFRITFDSCFREVISCCAQVPREEQDGTWIDRQMIDAYTRLHEAGYAHSVEAWEGESLVGGLYGVSLGRAFFGESMFSLASSSSKACLHALHRRLVEQHFQFIDCQLYTEHLSRLGARLVSRSDFTRMLKQALSSQTVRGDWSYWSGR